MARMYQSYQGPTDPSLSHSLIEGYQPVSRIGEVVINSFGAPVVARTNTRTRAGCQTAQLRGSAVRSASTQPPKRGPKRRNLRARARVLAVDSYEFTALNERITIGDVAGGRAAALPKPVPEGATEEMKQQIEKENGELEKRMGEPYEYKPHFHEW